MYSMLQHYFYTKSIGEGQALRGLRLLSKGDACAWLKLAGDSKEHVLSQVTDVNLLQLLGAVTLGTC